MAALVSPFRSLHHCGAPPFADLGNEGHQHIIYLVWLWFRSLHFGLAARMMRTSEPPHYAAPIRLISHSSSTPEFSVTRRRTVSPSASISPAVAPPRLIRKLQCISETCAPPRLRPRQPAASMSCQAL